MRHFLLLALAPILALSACASYVNIPPDSSEDLAINAINAPPTPRLLHDALGYVLVDHPAPQTPYAVRLPIEASERTWSVVLAGCDGAVAWSADRQDLPVYDVRSIRIRGNNAEVDIVVPQTRDNRPLLEVHLDGYLTGWRVTSMFHWPESVIQKRESTGQYQSDSAGEALRPISVHEEPPAQPPAAGPDSTEPQPEPAPASNGGGALRPVRPSKPGGG